MTELQRIKAAIFDNSYMDDLRGKHSINLDAFNSLCNDIEGLASMWVDAPQVDKELVGALYELVSMTLNQSLSTSWGEEERSQIWNLYTTLDRLFTECIT